MASVRRRATVSSVAGLIVAGSMSAIAFSTSPASAASSHTIKVFITKHRVVRMTGAMHPGVHKFVVRSGKASAFQLLSVRRGYSDRELARDAIAGPNGGNLKALARFTRNTALLGGVSSAPGARGVMYVNLPRGHRYVAVDTNATKNLARKLHHFRVAGARVAGALPVGPTIHATGDETYAARPASIPHAGLLTFANRSHDDHFIALAKLLPGKTIADWTTWVNAVTSGGNPGPPPVSENVGLDTGVLSPGARFTFAYHGLTKGAYVLTCFWTDVVTGMPHAFMGMYRELDVN
ncbi:MAG: hypothetical protein ACRDPI_07305 [Nocardioidaceae bacterium]